MNLQNDTLQRYSVIAELHDRYRRSLSEMFMALGRNDPAATEAAFKQCLRIEGEERQASNLLRAHFVDKAYRHTRTI